LNHLNKLTYCIHSFEELKTIKLGGTVIKKTEIKVISTFKKTLYLYSFEHGGNEDAIRCFCRLYLVQQGLSNLAKKTTFHFSVIYAS
jgi:hypothetical protein